MNITVTNYKQNSIQYSSLNINSTRVDEIIVDNQYELQHNRSHNDQILCIHQTQEKKWSIIGQ